MHDLDLVILKVLTTNKKYGLEFASQFKENIFAPKYLRFAKTVIDYLRIYKNVPTNRILKEKALASKNETFIKYINDILDQLDKVQYDDTEYVHDLEKFKNRFSEQLLNKLRESLSNEINISKNVNEIQNTLQNIKGLDSVKAYNQSTLKEGLRDFKMRYRAKLENPNFGIGTLTGLSWLDFTLGGLRNGELMLIGGETGSGKSMLLMNMAINMWLQGNTIEMEQNFKEGCDVLYFSLEMPLEDCQDRMVSRLAMVPQKKIRDAKLDDEESSKMSEALKFIDRYPYDLEIVDVPRGATIETIELIFNDVCMRRRKPSVVVVDYLGLMDYEGTETEDWLKYAKISEQLHEFGRVHDVVMLSAFQLNNIGQPKPGETAIGLHRISRSKQIAHNANFVIQIEKRKNEQECTDVSLHLIKSRRTELGAFKLHKDLSCCAMIDKQFVEGSNPDDISSYLSD